MWSLIRLPNVVPKLFVKVPLAIYVCVHFHNGGSVTDLLPFTHLALHMGGGISLRYFDWRHFRHARVNTTVAHAVDSLAATPVAANDSQRPVYVRMSLEDYQTDLIEWHAKDRELAVYGSNVFQPVYARRMMTDIVEWKLKGRELAVYGTNTVTFQPVCVPRITTDLIEWRLKDRELAVYGTSYPPPACLPRTPTDLIVWKLEDKELAVIPPPDLDVCVFDLGTLNDDDEPSVYIPYNNCELVSKILCLALAVSGAVVDVRRLRRTPATGQGMDKASDLPGDHAAAAGAGVDTGVRDAGRKGRRAETAIVIGKLIHLQGKDTLPHFDQKDVGAGVPLLIALFNDIRTGIPLIIRGILNRAARVTGRFGVFVDFPVISKLLNSPLASVIVIFLGWVLSSPLLSGFGFALGVCSGLVGRACRGLTAGQGGIKASAHAFDDVVKPPGHELKTVEAKQPPQKRTREDVIRQIELARRHAQCEDGQIPPNVEQLVTVPRPQPGMDATPETILRYNTILALFIALNAANTLKTGNEPAPVPKTAPSTSATKTANTERRKSKKGSEKLDHLPTR